jgi:short-subunit dehydrogenase
MYFQDKVAVITGGSDGIGKALVQLLLSKGAKVATCGRNYDKLYQLKTSHPNNDLFIFQADVSKEQECHKFIDEVMRTYGRIDLLINNAGISMRAEVADTDLDTLKRVMDINFWGTVYCSKYVLPHILPVKGTIVGVSSIAGFRGLPGRSGYSASKAAVNSFLEVLRTELLETGVNVMWVCPGFTTSNIRNVALNKDAQPQGETTMNEGEMMSAEECATHILHAVEKRKRTLVLTFTGKRAIFMNRFFPSLADKMVRKFFYKNGKLVK